MKVLLKRQTRYLLIGVFIAALVLAGIYFTGGFGLRSGIEVSPKLIQASKGLNQYNITVEFDPEAKTLACNQKVDYINKSDDSFTHLYFHLYPNAYRYENKPVFELSDMTKAYPNGFSSGYLDLSNVWIDGKEADFVVGGYSDNILVLLLEGDLAPQEKVMVEMDYMVVLPNSMGRFGYGNNMYKAANWYPIASVYDENGWNLDPYYAIGDPFYSDMANYHVSINAPADYTIAATGQTENKSKDGEKLIWNIHAPAVRDFAWLAGNTYETVSKKVGKTLVTSYYYTPEAGEKALDYAATSLAYFNDVFGEYPYSQFAVVESDFYIGGMEYPNLIMLDHSLYQRSNSDYLELVTVHETAHQWWYGLVGNNQIKDAWIDEGLTEYSTVLYYGHRYGQQREDEIYLSLIGEGKYNYLQFYSNSEKVDETIHRPSYEFSNWMIYDLLVYGKGAMLFHSIREEIGDELFFQSLQQYFNDHQFQNVNKSDLIHTFNQLTGQDWQQHFDQWLYDE